MTVRQMWKAFLKVVPRAAGEEMESWCYGGKDADHLAELTARGIKTATSSAYPMYKATGTPLPKAGVFSVVTRTDGSAVCVVYTSRVFVIPFCQVTEEQAWREGKGDRSLDHWRRVHEEFFSRDMTDAGLTFTHDTGVVCEEFTTVFPVLS